MFGICSIILDFFACRKISKNQRSTMYSSVTGIFPALTKAG
ncbi:hypothetical protein HMPREF9439_01387 [Parasutterella excrementihominis YIT 11859]|uniref:Uncharacterized protein n=1 Tax=Parasutterella excrementihominis YIT 11859 TaxID=762966 RepID=F3QKC9_9BURK|nr:hypothetical protein HMPREF9439_01387 [Parasutterella excrementihominis YIT 11859]